MKRIVKSLALMILLSGCMDAKLPRSGGAKLDLDNAIALRGQDAGDPCAATTDVGSPTIGRIDVLLVIEGALVQSTAVTLIATVRQIDPIYLDLLSDKLEFTDISIDPATASVTVRARITSGMNYRVMLVPHQSMTNALSW